MKANELMVGDWVMWKNRQVQIARVSGIVYSFGRIDVTLAHCNDDNLLETHDIKSVSPIPLTPEILEKNGFKECQYWYEYKSGDIIIQVALPNMRMKNGNKEFSTDDIRSVHQLQHTLRLCGIDKEIEL